MRSNSPGKFSLATAAEIATVIAAVATIIALIPAFGLWNPSTGATPTQIAQANATATVQTVFASTPIRPTTQPTNTSTPTQATTPTTIPTNTPSPTQVRTIPTSSSIPTLGIGSTKVSPVDGSTMMYVPAGQFLMGSGDGDKDANTDEKPQHTISLDAFWMDKNDVTNVLFKKCVDAGKCSRPSIIQSTTRSSYYGNTSFDNYPMIYVSWDDADAYCAWAGKKLPTEAQWEKAASWDDSKKEKRIYPWGNTFDKNLLNSSEGGKGDTTPVGSYPYGASPCGILDMAGNVSQWVADWYSASYYKQSPFLNPKNETYQYSNALQAQDYHVARGGSWADNASRVRSAYRDQFNPQIDRSRLGFRCTMSATQ